MTKTKRKRLCVGVGLAAGAAADVWLRLASGDEGNLLVHGVVFLGVAAVTAGIVWALTAVWKA